MFWNNRSHVNTAPLILKKNLFLLWYKKQDDCPVEPSSHCILLKIVGFLLIVDLLIDKETLKYSKLQKCVDYQVPKLPSASFNDR